MVLSYPFCGFRKLVFNFLIYFYGNCFELIWSRRTAYNIMYETNMSVRKGCQVAKEESGLVRYA